MKSLALPLTLTLLLLLLLRQRQKQGQAGGGSGRSCTWHCLPDRGQLSSLAGWESGPSWRECGRRGSTLPLPLWQERQKREREKDGQRQRQRQSLGREAERLPHSSACWRCCCWCWGRGQTSPATRKKEGEEGERSKGG